MKLKSVEDQKTKIESKTCDLNISELCLCKQKSNKELKEVFKCIDIDEMTHAQWIKCKFKIS